MLYTGAFNIKHEITQFSAAKAALDMQMSVSQSVTPIFLSDLLVILQWQIESNEIKYDPRHYST